MYFVAFEDEIVLGGNLMGFGGQSEGLRFIPKEDPLHFLQFPLRQVLIEGSLDAFEFIGLEGFFALGLRLGAHRVLKLLDFLPGHLQLHLQVQILLFYSLLIILLGPVHWCLPAVSLPLSDGDLLEGEAVGLALDVLPLGPVVLDCLAVPKQLPSLDGLGSASFHLLPLEDVEVPGVVVGLCGDDSGVVGVPDDDVGVAAGLDDPLPGVHVEDPGRVGRRDPHKVRRGQHPRLHPIIPDNGESVFDAVGAVGDLVEALVAHLLLCLREGAVVCGHSVQIMGGQQLQEEIFGLGIIIDDWRHDVASGMVPIFVQVVPPISPQTSSQPFSEHYVAFLLGPSHLLGSNLLHQVDHIERRVQSISNGYGCVDSLRFDFAIPGKEMAFRSCDSFVD
eukprot:CAMPEP_0170546982 /NCGR_PEP_ID=MMETSP0211-20121228/5352_1 /TAXON_ID=311385 /ORGANISM="Pseudokeronopsis sp., Strain OXSARD2" /LENGTH=390 /DNA_ID=CAMNT_0010851743 /DNA_START=965 /DNA_END=2137 /DNA_ORIENTATION=-